MTEMDLCPFCASSPEWQSEHYESCYLYQNGRHLWPVTENEIRLWNIRNEREMKVSSINAELATLREQSEQVCEWKFDDNQDDRVWDTRCGNAFWLEDDTPSENDMKFCPYCGKKLVEVIEEEVQE